MKTPFLKFNDFVSDQLSIIMSISYQKQNRLIDFNEF